MNKVLIVDASDSDRRLMSGLLVKSGYEPIAVESMEAAKEEVAKLPPGAVIVADASLRDSYAKELINWQNVLPHFFHWVNTKVLIFPQATMCQSVKNDFFHDWAFKVHVSLLLCISTSPNWVMKYVQIG